MSLLIICPLFNLESGKRVQGGIKSGKKVKGDGYKGGRGLKGEEEGRGGKGRVQWGEGKWEKG